MIQARLTRVSLAFYFLSLFLVSKVQPANQHERGLAKNL